MHENHTIFKEKHHILSVPERPGPHNPKVTPSSTTSPTKTTKILMIIGISAGATVLFLVIVIFMYYRHKRTSKLSFDNNWYPLEEVIPNTIQSYQAGPSKTRLRLHSNMSQVIINIDCSMSRVTATFTWHDSSVIYWLAWKRDNVQAIWISTKSFTLKMAFFCCFLFIGNIFHFFRNIFHFLRAIFHFLFPDKRNSIWRRLGYQSWKCSTPRNNRGRSFWPGT